jgi:acyl-CoA synthetase (AMP-forming)/AMP-acid ligase II
MTDVARRRDTVVGVLAERVERSPDRTAFTFLTDSGTHRSWTYAELDRQARAVAATLRDRTGVLPGDRVLLALPSGLDYIAALYGCFYAGAIAVPAYPVGKRVKGGAAHRLAAIAASAKPVAALGARPAGPDSTTWLAPAEIDLTAADGFESTPADAAEPAFLQYTSGSTGTPRGVVVTHANLVHNSAVISERFGTGEESVGGSWLPLFHDMGLIGGVLQPVHAGFPMVLMAPETFVREPVSWLRAISEHGITVSGGPTFGYQLCASAISGEVAA